MVPFIHHKQTWTDGIGEALRVMFLMSLGRWVFQLSRFLSGPRSTIIPASHPAEDILPGEVDALGFDSVANTEEEEPERDPT